MKNSLTNQSRPAEKVLKGDYPRPNGQLIGDTAQTSRVLH